MIRSRRNACTTAALAAAVLVLAGCGGGGDTPAPAHTLVPGGAAVADSALPDTSTVLTDSASVSAATAQAAPQATPAMTASTSAARTSTPPRGTDVARKPAAGGLYSLQLGSFRSLDNARRLVGQVQALGHAPVVESVVIGGETRHRVVLRGLPDRAEAASVGERLRSELGITYLIRQSD